MAASSIDKLLRDIVVNINTCLAQEAAVTLPRCGFDIPDKKTFAVSPHIIKLLNTLGLEVNHQPWFITYRVPAQALTRARAMRIKNEIETYLAAEEHIECVECHHLGPRAWCQACEACDQLICTMCTESHAYREEKMSDIKKQDN